MGSISPSVRVQWAGHRGQLCHKLERRGEHGRSRQTQGPEWEDGWQGPWESGFVEGVGREDEHEQRKAPHPTLGPKQLTWGAGGFLADPLQVPTPSRKLPAVSWPWDSRQLAPCLMMLGSTSFTGTLRKGRARLASCPPQGYPRLPRGQPLSSWGTEVSGEGGHWAGAGEGQGGQT